jgi:hypothetical protein
MPKTIHDVKVAIHRIGDHTEVVIARATIGEGQEGAWTMLVDGEHVGGGTAPADVALGRGGELRGRQLEISAILKDVRAETDRLTLTANVKPGPGPGPIATETRISNEVDPGDNAAYSIVVFFV